ncbi:MAG: SIMPL domain-containing protein [Bryobacteraceae bacterium]|nr:SIMPL domain-containing protein [Bryobacteraceae bacterium]
MQRLSFLLFATCLSVAAQESSPRWNTPHVRASGEGVVTVKPDRARLDLGVVTQAQTAAAAGAENAKTLSAVLAELKKTLPAGTEIETVGYSLRPDYRYGPNQKPSITGYTAQNTVRVTIDDMTAISRAIDVGTKYGANAIGGIQFLLKDEEGPRAKALAMAAQRARAEAQAMAGALGLKLGTVLSVEEGGGGGPVPMFRQAMAAQAAEVSTPVEPGTIEVRVSVVLTVALER